MAQRQGLPILVKLILWAAVIAAAAAPAAWWMTRETDIEVTATTIGRGPVQQTIAAISSGTVMPEERANIAVAILGTIAQVHVEEGDQVEAGALLVELEHTELDAQVELAEANVRAGKSRLAQVKLAAEIGKEVSATQLSQAAAQLELAQLDYNRVKSLADKNAVSQSNLEKIELGLRVARETHLAALAGQRENLVRQEEIAAAGSAIEQLEAAVEVARAMREKAFVRAPFPGVVAKVLLKRGEAVAMGVPVMHLVRKDNIYIEAPFDEAHAATIHVGQKARIELDAYSGTVFAGEVVYIAPVVAMNMDLSRTLNVKVHVMEGEEKFLPGMSADVTIVAEAKENALLAPSESLIRDAACYVIEGGRARLRDVKAGIGNWEVREVLDGLKEGDQIVTSVSLKELRDGVKVVVVDELPEK